MAVRGVLGVPFSGGRERAECRWGLSGRGEGAGEGIGEVCVVSSEVGFSECRRDWDSGCGGDAAEFRDSLVDW